MWYISVMSTQLNLVPKINTVMCLGSIMDI